MQTMLINLPINLFTFGPPIGCPCVYSSCLVTCWLLNITSKPGLLQQLKQVYIWDISCSKTPVHFPGQQREV